MSIGLVPNTAIGELRERMERSQQVGYDYERRATIEVVRCNVCRMNQTHPIAARDRYGFAVNCIECKNCHTAWLSPRMSDGDYQDFYSNWYRRILAAWYGREFTTEAIENDQTIYAKALCDNLPMLTGRDGQSMLDVGGSTGITAQAFSDVFGLKVTVLDPCEAELERAAGRGFATIHGCIESAGIYQIASHGPRLPSVQRFDVITMLQTIEHLSDPHSVLLKLKCLLKPKGLLIFDANQWQQQKRSLPVEKFVKIDHLYYFSDYAIRWLVGACGLKFVTRVNCIGSKVHYVCRA